ncbi:Holliday junction branch migration protein RuvA [Enorma phocaeensis]|uniref:Holliday junction branch migration complex subunit RuvA n=1 Tax=Enorma phocaeensis TaxID=1871019 RepID=A0ABT7V6V1_9ACTN|nr:Holliday junction branch migration protein RuvA [Enorma phocaeensis]MDM8274223.1 Holliday junction branch migration protein RuvA [Enorma phocaeensis]
MIAQLRGTLIEATMSAAVIDVGGVGYEVGISATTAAGLPPAGDEVRLYTRMRISNDAVALFGFLTASERMLFDRLISVSSVGPRLALSVLSKFSVEQLYTVVLSEDAKAMATVPGVGKKTAQRLILELKGTFAKERGLVGADLPAAGQLPIGAPDRGVLEDAREALLSMGFSPQETDLALEGYDGRDMRVEDVLAAALKRLGMGA